MLQLSPPRALPLQVMNCDGGCINGEGQPESDVSLLGCCTSPGAAGCALAVLPVVLHGSAILPRGLLSKCSRPSRPSGIPGRS